MIGVSITKNAMSKKNIIKRIISLTREIEIVYDKNQLDCFSFINENFPFLPFLNKDNPLIGIRWRFSKNVNKYFYQLSSMLLEYHPKFHTNDIKHLYDFLNNVFIKTAYVEFLYDLSKIESKTANSLFEARKDSNPEIFGEKYFLTIEHHMDKQSGKYLFLTSFPYNIKLDSEILELDDPRCQERCRL